MEDRGKQNTSSPLWKVCALGLGASVVLALCATAVCGYRYGVYDQGQYIVQMLQSDDPALFAGDPYTGAFASLGSVFWLAIGRVSSEGNLAATALTLTLIIATVNALLLWGLGLTLISRSRLAGRAGGWCWVVGSLAPAMALVVPKEDNWFGLVSLSDIELTATLAALPFVFASMLLFARGATIWSLVVAASVLPIHGQTGAYLLVAWWVATLLMRWREVRWRVALAVIGVLGAAGVAAAWWSSRVPAGALDEYEVVGFGLYAALIDPTQASLSAWSSVIGIMALGVAASVCLRTEKGAGGSRARAHFMAWWAASAAFPLVGLALHAAGVRDPLLWKLMVGRSLMLPQIGALVMVAVWAVTTMAGRDRWRRMAGLAVLLIVVAWPMPKLGLIGAGACVALLGAAMVSTLWHGDWRRCFDRRAPRVASGVLAAFAVIVMLGAVGFASRPFPWLRSGEDGDWLEAQRWARSNTTEQCVFITPPYLSGWRVGSRRATFGEVKDGCLLFYGGEVALDWAGRMEALGMEAPFNFIEAGQMGGDGRTPWREADLARVRDGYRTRVCEGLDELTAQSGAWHVVVENTPGFEELDGCAERAWSNGSFTIYRVSESMARGGESSQLASAGSAM